MAKSSDYSSPASEKTSKVNIGMDKIRHTVASSTAIETGVPIFSIEKMLESGTSKFSHLKLAD